MHKKLFSSILLFLLLNILIKPFWILGIDVGVQNAVGAEEFGLYFAIFNFTYIFNILLDLGITNFNNKNIAQHSQLISKHLSGILGIKLILFAVFVLVTFAVGWAVGYRGREFLLLAWMCLNQFLNSLILYLRSNFSGLLMFKTDSVLSIMDRMLMIIFCSLLLWGNICEGPFRIEWFIGSQTLSYLITAGVALVALVGQTHLRKLRLNPAFSIAIVRRSLPFALLVLLMASYNRIDPIMLERLLPSGNLSAGIYAGAYRLLDALVMLAYLVSVPLLPVYAKMLKNNDDVRPISRNVFVCVFAFSAGIAISLSCLAEELMAVLYESHAAQSANVFKVLIFGFVPISVTYVFGTLLTANNSLRQLNILSAIALCINVVLNLVLIPRYAEVGSAWTSVGTQSFVAISQMVVAMRIFQFKIGWPTTLRLLIYICIVAGINFGLSHLGIHWIWHIVVVGMAMLAMLFGLGLFSLKDVRSIIAEH